MTTRKIKSYAKTNFSRLLKSLRMKSDTAWTQASLAKALNVAPRTYKGWENGEAIPTPEYLQQIVGLLNLNKEDEDALYRAALQVPQIRDNLPFKQNPFFTGREEHLERLRHQLQETGTAAITQPVSISGLGGVGKTELALEYAHRFYPDMYRAVLWVDADMVTIESSYANLTEILKLPERNEQALGRRVQAVKDWLNTHTDWLLIMDNADDLPLAESFLPSQPHGHVVFTTQSRSIGTTTQSRHIEVEALEPDKGLLLLLRRSDMLEDDTTPTTVAAGIREAALEVVKLLGGLPLALDQAGAYIKETGASFTDYVKRYNAERHRLLDRRQLQVSRYSRHPEAIAATLNLSIKKASEQHPVATTILNFCAFLYPDTIPEEVFQYDDRFNFGTTDFDDAVAALQRFSLIKRKSQNNIISLHRLVQVVVMDEMFPDIKTQWRARVLRTLCSMLPEVASNTITMRLALLHPHELMHTIGEEDESAFMLDISYLSLGAALYLHAIWSPEAGSLLERSLAIRERYLGTDHPDTLLSLLHLAKFHWSRHNYEQTELLCARALPICERWWGMEYIYTERCRNLLVDSYYNQYKDEQAVSVWQRVLADRERRLGTEHLEVVYALRNLATLYAAIPGKLAESESFYLRALAILEKLQLNLSYYIGELSQLVSQALQEQRSGEMTIAIQDKIREEVSENLMTDIIWGQWPELKLPNTRKTRSGYAKFLHSKGRYAEAEAMEANDKPSEC